VQYLAEEPAVGGGAMEACPAPGATMGQMTAAAAWPDPCRHGGVGHYGGDLSGVRGEREANRDADVTRRNEY
jgi:hypothetical protein